MLLPLPDQRKTRIVVGTTCRKPLEILKAHLASLDYQDLPTNTVMIPVMVPDFAPDQQDAQQYLFQWVNERGGTLLQGVPAGTPDFSDAAGLPSHQWGQSAMARVGANKNKIIQFAIEAQADYLLFCDSDLILDRTTVASLLASDKHVVTGVYWTKWTNQTTETGRVDAGPQVWLQHPYTLEGRGMDAAEFRQKLLNRELTRVWGFGALTLLSRKVLEAGLNFDYLPDVPLTGLLAGEDRHFCIRAERMHIDAWADCWPDCFHIYHAATDIPKIPAMLARLGAVHPQQPALGDLVSVRIRALEPIMVGPGRMQHIGPQWLRGRIGQMAILPEIEEAIYGLSRGQTATITVHFPVHYPIPQLRGRTRLTEIFLVDCKRNCAPPVVEEELYVGPKSGAWTDRTTLTPDQEADRG